MLLAAQMSDDAPLSPGCPGDARGWQRPAPVHRHHRDTELIHLPDGLPSTTRPVSSTRFSADLAGKAGTVVVPDGGSLDVRFPGGAVTSATRITGDTAGRST